MPNETDGAHLLAHRYRLVTQVGRGGMGTVWHAHDEVLGRDVAVKEVILPHGLTDEERDVQYKRTFREARTAARLGHPGVVTVYDVVEEDGRPWIIMELVQARSLDQVIKQEGPLEARRAAEIGRQMLAALHAAHEAGVLHRDVKPSNVLVTRGDRAVLTDFGIATASGDATLTQTGLVMGSPAYIAPERARGRTAGPASDLWSLGVTLYAMVSGRSPFERSEPMAALVAVISEDPEPPSNAGRLGPVIEGLLRKNPDHRMGAIEAGALLDDIVRQETIDTQRTLAVEVPIEELLAGGPLPGQPSGRTADAPAPEAPPVPGAFTPQPDPSAPEPAPAAEAPAPEVPPASAPTRVSPVLSDDATRQDQDPAAAHAWRPGPATEPAQSPFSSIAGPGGRPGLANNRNALVIGAIVIVILLALVGLLLANGDKGKDANKQANTTSPQAFKKSQQSQTSPGGKSPSPTTASPSETSAVSGVPEGWKRHNDPSGFSIVIPKDWSGPKSRSSAPQSVFFEPPSGEEGYIQIDQTSDPSKSALDDWKKYEPAARGRFAGYEQIKIAPVTEGKPVADPSGAKAADWEWTYDGKSGDRLHALNRGFVMNGTGYAIVLVAPDDDWEDTFAEFAPLYQLFKPDRG